MTAGINDNIQIATTNIDFTILKPQWDNTTGYWYAGITCTNKNTGSAPPSNELLPALKELEFIRYTVSLTTNEQVDFKVSLYPALTFKSNPSTGAAEAFWNLLGFPTDPSELLSGWIEFDKTLTTYSTTASANTIFKGKTTTGTQSLADVADNKLQFVLRISIPPLTPVNLSDISGAITTSSNVDTFTVKFKVGGPLKVSFVEDLLSKNGQSSYLTKLLNNSLVAYASSVSTTTNNISLAQALKIADFLDDDVTLNGDILEANSVATKVTVRVVNKNSGVSDTISFAYEDVKTTASGDKQISVICVPSDTLLVFLHISNDAGTTSWIISKYSSYPLKENLIITSTPRPDGAEIFINYPFLASQTIYFSIVYESKILGSIELGPSDTDGKSTVITNSAFQQYIPIEVLGFASFTGQALVVNGVISQNTKSDIIKFVATPGASSSSAVLSLLNNVVQPIVDGVKAVSFDINKLLSVIESDNVSTYFKITITSTASSGTADAEILLYGIIKPNSFSIDLFNNIGNSTDGKAITIGANTTSKKISLQIYNINPEYGTLNTSNNLLINTLAADTVYLRNIQNISTTLLIASLPNALNLLQIGAATIDGMVKVNGEVDGDNWDTLTVSVSILNNDETQTKVLIKQSDSTTGYYIDLLRSSFNNSNTFAALLQCVGGLVGPVTSLAIYAIVKKTYGPSITLQTKPAFAYYDPLNVLVKFSDLTATSGVVTFMSNEPFGVIVYTKVVSSVVTNASACTSSTLTTTGWYRHYAKVTGATLNLISVAASGAPIGFKTLAPADSM